MSQQDQREKSKERRIENLRDRLRGHVETAQLRDVLKGVLDLLADEL